MGKSPVTKELLAMKIGNSDYKFIPLSRDEIDGVFYKEMEKLVHYCVRGYNVPQADYDDAVQACWIKLWKNIDKFDIERGSLSLFVNVVCRSQLANDYKKRQRRADVFSDGEDIDPAIESSTCLGMDVKYIVEELFEKYSSKRAILAAMFGSDDEFYFNKSIQSVSDEAGVNYFEAYRFYKNVVIPFFRSRMGEN
jgi:RNA polymerase sigma factor (sigma-70 family)